MTDQRDLLPTPPEADLDRLRSHDADFTPVIVALLGALAALARSTPRPRVTNSLRVLVPFAGPGVHVQAARALTDTLWPSYATEITAIEVRPEERPRLLRTADHVITADAFAHDFRGARFEAIVDNPPFGRFYEAIPLLRPLLAAGGCLTLFGRSTVGQRSPAGCDAYIADSPVQQIRIPGPLRFRDDQINPKTARPYQSDMSDYSLWLWDAKPDPDIRPRPWLPCLALELAQLATQPATKRATPWHTSNALLLPSILRRSCANKRPGTHGWHVDLNSDDALTLDHSVPEQQATISAPAAYKLCEIAGIEVPA